MSLRKSNPHLKTAKGMAALRLSADSSSAVEGIRAPSKKMKSEEPESVEALVRDWKKRAASSR